MSKNGQKTALDPVTNDGKEAVEIGAPYIARIEIEGVAPILFHRYSCEAVIAKSEATKNSKAKKTDDVESYVYRCEDGTLGIPGQAMKAALVGAGRSRQDPRSPRKSAIDLYKAIIIPLEDIATTGKKDWDYIDQRRAVVQRNAVNRSRPALLKGWKCAFSILIQAPEYLDAHGLQSLAVDAGRFCGLGDFRPTYGRFSVVGFKIQKD